MLDIIRHQQWIVIALAFFGILAYIVIIRWRDRKWIDERFGNPNLRAMSFGVNYASVSTTSAELPNPVNRAAAPVSCCCCRTACFTAAG